MAYLVRKLVIKVTKITKNATFRHSRPMLQTRWRARHIGTGSVSSLTVRTNDATTLPSFWL